MDTSTLCPLTEAEILAAVAAQRDEAVAFLQELVRAPSLLGHEASAQALMKRRFEALGLDVRELVIDEAKLREHPGYSPSLVSYDGRRNVIGVHEPRPAKAGGADDASAVRGRSLILNGHIDVVPVGAERLWTSPPFEPRIDGDRLYGRGANDMKGGIVAYTMALRALQRLGVEPAARVTLQSVIEEECTGNGALACLLAGYTADAAIIPEPFDELLSAQLGVMWLTLDVYGVPVHAAVAQTGIGAIEFAQHLVAELRKLEAKWNEPQHRHAMYCRHDHPINFNLGRIEGGEWSSSVSTHCRADLRLGFYPGVKPAEVRAEVEALIRQAHAAHPAHAGVEVEISYHGFQAEGLVVDLQQPALQALMQAHHDITGQPAATRAATATTDLRFFHLYGQIPSTCYGPRGANIHGVDEWVSIDSMQQVTAVLALFMARWCGVQRAG
ncbi:MAG: ArgE/DapE family deacylase [Burkholderiales bacterium]|nr:ArgE/DapE family deacylase [Burkholderiales bacterium]